MHRTAANHRHIVCGLSYFGSFLDIDECDNAVMAGNTTICGTGTFNCSNTEGSYECNCKPGYRFNAATKLCEGEVFE